MNRRALGARDHTEPVAVGSGHDRIRGLDGLRAIAALAVVAFHGAYWLAPGGRYGVDVFLVLSGYLITTILVRQWRRRGSIGYSRFLVRRLLRLYPPVVFLLACYLLGAAVLPGRFGLVALPDALAAASVAALYLTNVAFGYNVGDVEQAFLHTWSLAMEMQFYLVWPLVLVGVLRLKSGRARGAAIGVLVVAAIVAQQVRLHVSDRGPELTFEGRALALVLGCGLVFALPWLRTQSRWLPAVGWVGVVALAGCFLASDAMLPLTVALPVVAFASAAVIAAVVVGQSTRLTALLDTSILEAVGVRSYSLYLWHFPVLGAFTAASMPGLSTPVRTLAALLAVALLTEIAYRLVERPALRRLSQRP